MNTTTTKLPRYDVTMSSDGTYAVWDCWTMTRKSKGHPTLQEARDFAAIYTAETAPLPKEGVA